MNGMTTFYDPKNTALLVIDIQYDYCSPDGVLAQSLKYTMQNMEAMIARLSPFIDRIRASGCPVIFLRMIEDPDFMAPNAARKIRSHAKPIVLCSPDTKGFEFFGVEPLSDDVQLIKNNYDAFSSIDLLTKLGIKTRLLQDLLLAKKVETLIFTGVITSRCVDSTLRSAFRLGYNCIAVADMVGVPDQLMFEQEATLNLWQAVFAYVTVADDLVAVGGGKSI
jgi:ureidoacrylate peracid hydrolase